MRGTALRCADSTLASGKKRLFHVGLNGCAVSLNCVSHTRRSNRFSVSTGSSPDDAGPDPQHLRITEIRELPANAARPSGSVRNSFFGAAWVYGHTSVNARMDLVLEAEIWGRGSDAAASSAPRNKASPNSTTCIQFATELCDSERLLRKALPRFTIDSQNSAATARTIRQFGCCGRFRSQFQNLVPIPASKSMLTVQVGMSDKWCSRQGLCGSCERNE